VYDADTTVYTLRGGAMRFFALVDDMGIRQDRLAARMGVSKTLFTLVKQGVRRASADFKSRGTAAFAEMGIWHPEGRAYTETELFDAPLDTAASESDTQGSRAAAYA
jgi:hypothetical protein